MWGGQCWIFSLSAFLQLHRRLFTATLTPLHPSTPPPSGFFTRKSAMESRVRSGVSRSNTERKPSVTVGRRPQTSGVCFHFLSVFVSLIFDLTSASGAAPQAALPSADELLQLLEIFLAPAAGNYLFKQPSQIKAGFVLVLFWVFFKVNSEQRNERHD